MVMKEFLDFIYSPIGRDWGEKATEVMSEWASTRYGKKWDKKYQLRVNGNAGLQIYSPP
jgi:hypothetical protein